MWKIVYTKQALKDKDVLPKELHAKAKELIAIIKNNPFQNPPAYEKLTSKYKNQYSRRINKKHRLWYQVFKEEKVIKIIRAADHYGE